MNSATRIVTIVFRFVAISLVLILAYDWIAYLLTAMAIAKNLKIAYPLSLVLAILTLVVSLPQPEHQSLVEAGPSPASLTFIVGSVLQVAVILTVSSYLVLTRMTSRKGLPQDSLHA